MKIATEITHRKTAIPRMILESIPFHFIEIKPCKRKRLSYRRLFLTIFNKEKVLRSSASFCIYFDFDDSEFVVEKGRDSKLGDESDSPTFC